MIARSIVFAAVLSTLAVAQPAKWFPTQDLMTIGVYYYPEAWPESQWERDISNIKKFGFEYIHVAEVRVGCDGAGGRPLRIRMAR